MGALDHENHVKEKENSLVSWSGGEHTGSAQGQMFHYKSFVGAIYSHSEIRLGKLCAGSRDTTPKAGTSWGEEVQTDIQCPDQ